MKDLSYVDDEAVTDLKAHLNSTLLNAINRCDGGGSSSSIDSKDSKGSKSGAPSIIEDFEKNWFKSSSRCDLDSLKELIVSDIELLNKKDYFTGFAAIHWAAKTGKTELLAWLYEQKADMNLRTSGGYPPLHIATIHRQEVTIQKLIDHYDADINLRDYSGKKARHYLSPTMSASVSRALQETPSICEMKLDPLADIVSMEGYSTPTAIRKSFRRPLVKVHTLDEDGGGFRRIKKKGLSLSNSFKMKKKNYYTMKREDSNIEDFSPKLGSKFGWARSPSVPDIVTATEKESKFSKRKSSVVEYSTYMATEDDLITTTGRSRKNSVSDLYINGYAGFINDNKHHPRKQHSSEHSKEYSINTWI